MKNLLLSIFCLTFFLSAEAQIPNPGFEIQDTNGHTSFWQSVNIFAVSLDSNCFWTGLDSISFSTSDAHSGNYAFEMRVATYCQSAFGGNVKPVHYNVDSFFADQRVPFTERPLAFSFYYKLLPLSGDFGYVEVALDGDNSFNIANGFVKLTQATPGWTLATIPLAYHNTDTPALLTLKFKLSNDTALHFSSRFLIDDINHIGTAGIKTEQLTTTLTCFPVPAEDKIFFYPGNKMKTGFAQMSIIDAMGKFVKQESILLEAGKNFEVNIEELSKGVYFLKLVTPDIVASGKFVK